MDMEVFFILFYFFEYMYVNQSWCCRFPALGLYTFIGIPLVNWVKMYLIIPGLMSAQRSGGLANICLAVQMHIAHFA